MATIGSAEAARRLGISQARVRQLIKAGRLPATRLGRDWAIEERHLVKVAVRKTGRPRKG
jgi:excisionase family DNA binding protein